MGRSYSEMNTSSAAGFGGYFAAFAASLLLVFAGIATAVSVVFFAGNVFVVRLCLLLMLSVILAIRSVSSAPSPAPMR